MNSTRSQADDQRFLPQSGFGRDVDFESIVRYNRFLFRVYTPKALPVVEDDSVFFVGPRFNESFAPRTPILTEIYTPAGGPLSETATYENCVQHLCWETRSTSPFVSASFSFAWALWDAVRRFESGVKHNVEIAVIDAPSLSGKAVTTLQLLRKSSATGKHAHHWQWCRFAEEAQSVLIHGFVPRSAVLASIPLLSVLERLPSYFLSPTRPERQAFSSLHQILGWDLTDKKSSYRKFCQDMTSRYLEMPLQTRARDGAVSSVRLSITFLHPWLQKTIEEDFDLAIARLLELSSSIARWPEQLGAQDHTEMNDFMKALLIQPLSEEVRVDHTRQATTEAPHLQVVIDSLEEAVHAQEQQYSIGNIVDQTLSHSLKRPSLEPLYPEKILSSSSPQNSLKITIPASPIVSSSSSASSDVSLITPTTLESLEPSSSHISNKLPAKSSPVNPPSPDFSSTSSYPSPPPSPIILPSAHPSLPPSPLKIHAPLSMTESRSSITSPSSYHSALSPPTGSSAEEKLPSPTILGLELDVYDSEDETTEDETNRPVRPSLPETVSCVITGFLVGAFITLCILSSQRRTLIHLT